MSKVLLWFKGVFVRFYVAGFTVYVVNIQSVCWRVRFRFLLKVCRKCYYGLNVCLCGFLLQVFQFMS